MSLWKSFQSFLLIWIVSPRRRSHKHHISDLETSFCTCRKAALTVEAAIVIPLTAGFLVAFLFLFRVMQVQVAIDEAIMYAGRKVAVESSYISSEEALFLSAETFLLVALDGNEIVERYVENGIWGVSLLLSEFQEKEIVLHANYRMTLPVGFFGTIEIPLYSQNRFHKWTGNGYDSDEEEWVYVTKYGTVYHSKKECQALEVSVQASTLSEIGDIRGLNGQKYYACGSCEEETKKGIVYYTDYGTLYHGDISCSALKRLINKIPFSEVGERSACSFCY